GRATSANTGATVAGKQPPKHPASPVGKTEDARERRQERRQERGRQRQGALGQRRRNRGRQGDAQASGIAGGKTEGARDRSQEKGRQRQGKFRQQRHLRRGLARDGRLGPVIRSRAHGELNRRRVPALIFESTSLIWAATARPGG